MGLEKKMSLPGGKEVTPDFKSRGWSKDLIFGFDIFNSVNFFKLGKFGNYCLGYYKQFE